MRITPYAEWSFAQHLAAEKALKAHEVRMKDHPFVSPGSTDLVIERLINGDLRAAFIEGYLLVYDVGASWCSTQPLLYEFLLVRALPGGSFEDAVTGMRIIAQLNECSGVLSGNGVLRPGLARLYERAGAVKHAETYFIGV